MPVSPLFLASLASALSFAAACTASSDGPGDGSAVADGGAGDAVVNRMDASRQDAAAGDAFVQDAGDAGRDAGGGDAGDAGRDAGGGGDAVVGDGGGGGEITASGQLVRLGDLLAGTTAGVGQAAVLAVGVVPARSTITDNANGNYTLQIPGNGQTILYANKAGYFPTYNPIAAQGANITGRAIYAAENAWLNAIAQTHGVDLAAQFACHAPALNPNQQCIYTVVVGRVLDDGTAGNGTQRPVADVNNFTIAAGAAGANLSDQWYKRGPYYLNYDGTASAAATGTIVYDDSGNFRGGLFVAFLEIPRTDGAEAINVRVSAQHTPGGATRYFGPAEVKAFRPYGVTWVTLNETAGPPNPPPPSGVSFDAQVYPLFLPVAQGGLGCQGCHTNQGGATPSGGLNLYGADAAYAALDPANNPQRVNVQNPGASTLLIKPLYEASGSQDHPIFAFVSEQDPAYRLIYTWIQEGGRRVQVQQPVSFANDVRPLLAQPTNQGGIGCYNCHASGVNANNAPGGFYTGGTPDQLYAELTQEMPTDNGGTGEGYRINKTAGQADRSLVLTNPLYNNAEPHPVKVFSSNADPRYQTIYRWITEGYAR
ncbi:MAG: hypothetical protein IT384_02900 [Deltaproteobacteria bacterium]|nr:hypothetical protein [Deltaproteobacteria bacterium]